MEADFDFHGGVFGTGGYSLEPNFQLFPSSSVVRPSAAGGIIAGAHSLFRAGQNWWTNNGPYQSTINTYGRAINSATRNVVQAYRLPSFAPSSRRERRITLRRMPYRRYRRTIGRSRRRFGRRRITSTYGRRRKLRSF